jgi:putative ABC transport system permease protein
MGMGEIWMIGGLALVVLLSACFNYMNLSIAKALNRAREIGVRKVIGATRKHVMAQLIVEAIFISLLSVTVAFGLFLLIRTPFLRMNPDLADMIVMSMSVKVLLWFLLLAVFTGLLAGIVPAAFFSRLNAVHVLKSTKAIKGFRHVNMRKALIVVQYTVSIIFIASTLIGFHQYKHFVAFDLGYRTKDIFNLNLQGNKPEVLTAVLSQIPEVKQISSSALITSVGNYWGSQLKYAGDSSWANYNQVDANYLPLHNHHLISGRNFSPRTPEAPESEIIVNTDVLKRFKIGDGDPIKAIDETVLVDKKEMKIVGVVEDFHYGKVDSRSDLVIFRQADGKEQWLNVDVRTDNWPATFAKIEMAWRKVDNVHPMVGQLYDEQIKKSYGSMSAMLTLVGALAMLAICISSLGLFGMVVFGTESRLKEVSIRKVMGAAEWRLVYLMGKGFIALLAIAAVIAIPLTYIFFQQVALPELVNPAPIGFVDLFGGLIAILIIALAMIGSQTFKVARANPADVLRAE